MSKGTTPSLPALDNREQAIAEGCALIRNGTSERDASKITGIAKTTLHEAHHRMLNLLRSPDTDREEILRQADQRILENSIVLSDLAAQVTIEGLLDGEIKGKTAAVAYGIATDKVGDIRGYRNKAEQTDGTQFARVMERLAELAPVDGSASVSVTVSRSAPASSPTTLDVKPLPSTDTDAALEFEPE